MGEKFKEMMERRKLNNPTICWSGVGDGWVNILEEMFDKLEAIGWKGKVAQIKEKFSILRIYLSDETPEVDKIVNAAIKKSSKTCEDCGNKGKIGGEYWLRTLCDECRTKWDNRK